MSSTPSPPAPPPAPPPGPPPGSPPSTEPTPAPAALVDPTREAARADRRRAFRVGLVALLSTAILASLLVVTGPLAVLHGRDLAVDFAFAGPIKPGAPVRISGIVVGAVQSVELLAGQDLAAGPDKMVRVHARVEERAMPVVTERARFRVTTLGVLGEHYLDVEPRPGGTPLPDGARVDGESLARPDLLLPRAAGLLERADAFLPSSPEAAELVRSLSSLLSRLDDVLAGDAGPGADDDVRGLLADLRALVRGAAVGIGDGKALRRSVDRLPAVLDKAEQLEDALQEGGAGALVGEARASLARLDRTLELVGDAPLLDRDKQEQLRVEVGAAMRSLDALSRRGDRLLRVVEQGQGGAGKLFWDESVAADLKAVLSGLRENPMRFLLGREP